MEPAVRFNHENRSDAWTTTVHTTESLIAFNQESRSDAWTTIAHTTESPSDDDAGWEGSDLGSGEDLDLGK